MIRCHEHGYVKFIEDWGRGECGIAEAGIIEAARQSTQGSFRGWNQVYKCKSCDSLWEKIPDQAGLNRVSDLSGDCCSVYNMEIVHQGDQKLLAFLYNNEPKHATPFEFAGMTIEVQAPIFVFREWHRHRTQSYNEMSARYAPVPDVHYLPTVDRCMRNSTTNRQAGVAAGAAELTGESAQIWLDMVDALYQLSENVYQKGLEIGVPKEVARVGMCVGRYSRMRATGNLRNWLAFCTLRMDPGAQEEIRVFAHAVGTIIEERFSNVYALFNAEFTERQQRKNEKLKKAYGG